MSNIAKMNRNKLVEQFEIICQNEIHLPEPHVSILKREILKNQEKRKIEKIEDLKQIFAFSSFLKNITNVSKENNESYEEIFLKFNENEFDSIFQKEFFKIIESIGFNF